MTKFLLGFGLAWYLASKGYLTPAQLQATQAAAVNAGATIASNASTAVTAVSHGLN